MGLGGPRGARGGGRRGLCSEEVGEVGAEDKAGGEGGEEGGKDYSPEDDESGEEAEDVDPEGDGPPVPPPGDNKKARSESKGVFAALAAERFIENQLRAWDLTSPMDW